MAALAVSLMGTVTAYASGVSLPDDPQVPQASVLYYNDGTTVLARVGISNRTDVTLSDIPVSVRESVLAAEDRQFYDHFGLSLKGVARAVWADLSGGSQGASTITQQYVRNAYLTQERTASRKAREAVLAIKMESKYSKDEILERYLNTIYFGRGAYGIAAAARAYFNTTTSQLTTAQGAVLASVIKDPWNFDPDVDETGAQERWQWVINAMVDQSWLDESTASATVYPEVLDRSSSGQSLSGPNGLIVDAVEQELVDQGISSQTLRTGGLRVVTTIDQSDQEAAIEQMSTISSVSADLHGALVAVDPATGAVRAYYGGKQGQGYYDDAAAARPAASTFKAIVLAAGIAAGVSYLSEWDGSSPRTFDGRLGVPLYNEDNIQCPDCTLDEAMVQSLNTTYYALGERVGANAIRELAFDMGISETYDGTPALVDVEGDPLPGETRTDIAIGRYAVSPADLASVYATLASGGVSTERHFVESVTGMDKETWYEAVIVSEQVIDPDVAADVTTVLHDVAENVGEPEGHEAALKTGTQQWGNTSDNQDAWLAGYTPQLATTVWLGTATPGPIRDAEGNAISGDGLPAQLWQSFMTQALSDEEVVSLPEPAHLGSTEVGDAGAASDDSQTTSGGLTLVDHTRSGGKTLALTFDDGPSAYTDEVLDLLASYDIKATFCVVGEQVSQYEDAMRRIIDEGHELCNHTMYHDDVSTMTTDEVYEDLYGTISATWDVVSDANYTYFRAPGGSWGDSAQVGADLGMTPITWTVDPEDWDTPGTAAIVQAVNEQLEPGGIVLMHDGGGDRSQTIAALKILIPQLLSDGWTFDLPAVTVDSVDLEPTQTASPSVSATAGSSQSPGSTPSTPVNPQSSEPARSSASAGSKGTATSTEPGSR